MKSVFTLLSFVFTASVSLAGPPDFTQYAYNDLFSDDPCKQHLIIFARGYQPYTDMGREIGPSFFHEVANLVGVQNLAIQTIPTMDFPISPLISFDVPKAGDYMRGVFSQATAKCPQSNITLAGWSIGAKTVHEATKYLGQGLLASRVSSVVTFGDPWIDEGFTWVPEKRILAICHDNDYCCSKQGSKDVHGDYLNETQRAAAFVVEQASFPENYWQRLTRLYKARWGLERVDE